MTIRAGISDGKEEGGDEGVRRNDEKSGHSAWLIARIIKKKHEI